MSMTTASGGVAMAALARMCKALHDGFAARRLQVHVLALRKCAVRAALSQGCLDAMHFDAGSDGL